MIRLIVFLLAAFAIAHIATLLAESGDLTLQWQQHNITLPIGLVAAALCLFVVAAIFIYEIYRVIVSLPEKWKRERKHHHELSGYQALITGLVAAAAGDSKKARAQSVVAEKHLGERVGLLLLNAQIAQLKGQEDARGLYFQEMVKIPTTRLLGLRGKLSHALEENDEKKALSLAKRAFDLSPQIPWVAAKYFDLLIQAKDWQAALDVTNAAKKFHQKTPPLIRRRKGLLRHVRALEFFRSENIPDAYQESTLAMKDLPEFAPVHVLASRIAVQRGKENQARQIIEQCWQKAPHPELIKAYAEIKSNENAAERLERFQGLERANPDHVETYAMMGALAISAGQLDLAEHNLLRAVDQNPRAGVYRLMAEHARLTGKYEDREHWMALVLKAPPDRRWVCLETRTVMQEWWILGPAGHFDSVHWSEPPQGSDSSGLNGNSQPVEYKNAQGGIYQTDPI